MQNSSLIVALDTETAESAYEYVKKLDNLVNFYKIGLGLFPQDAFELAEKLKDEGKKVFLDLKLFDIDSTISRVVRNLVQNLAPDFLTVHGDPKIVQAAVQGKENSNTKILAVTLLTSLDRKDLDEMLISKGSLEEIVRSRTARAFAAGADGIIASPLEIAILRKLPACKDKIIVTPGIRLAGNSKNQRDNPDDQKRTATPLEAIQAGADHFVIGRPILESPDPAQTIKDILEEIKDE